MITVILLWLFWGLMGFVYTQIIKFILRFCGVKKSNFAYEIVSSLEKNLFCFEILFLVNRKNFYGFLFYIFSYVCFIAVFIVFGCLFFLHYILMLFRLKKGASLEPLHVNNYANHGVLGVWFVLPNAAAFHAVCLIIEAKKLPIKSLLKKLFLLLGVRFLLGFAPLLPKLILAAYENNGELVPAYLKTYNIFITSYGTKTIFVDASGYKTIKQLKIGDKKINV